MLKHIQSTEEWNEKSLGAKGFTLIELLVVIVILGILAAVVVFAVSGITDRGQQSACKTDRRTIQTAAEAYIAQEEPTSGTIDGDDLEAANFLSEFDSATALHTVEITGGTPPDVDITAQGKCA